MNDRGRLDLLQRSTAPENSHLPTPSALLIFAHPDDETLALGARLCRFRSAHLVHVTDGAPLDEFDSRANGFTTLAAYREARAAELETALHLAGVGDIRRKNLGIPDQGAALNLLSLTREILHLLHAHQPEVVFTHPYEGGHPDHDSCSFAVHTAVNLLHTPTPPLIVEPTSYHSGPDGIETGRFLHPSPDTDLTYHLTPAEQAHKQALLRCFTTQGKTLRYFGTTTETFRTAPTYDFTHLPDPRPAFYDRFPWPLKSTHFSDFARDALADLGIPEAPCP